MLPTLRKVLDLFERRERWSLLGLFGLMVLMALLQAVSVASILPFMSVVASPEAVGESAVLSWLYTELAFAEVRHFLVFVGALVLVLMAISNGVSAFTQWLMLRFAWHQQYQLAVRLMARYLGEPYSFFLSRNSANLVKNMFVEVREAIEGVVMQGMRMVAQVFVVGAIFTLLVVVDPVLALTATLVLGTAYGLVYTLVRREQARLGRLRTKVNDERFRFANEALGGIKESRVLGREWGFLERFAKPTRKYSEVSAKNHMIIELPRYALETVAFGGVLLIVLYILGTRDDFGQVVAVTSLYALAGYRLMPALQQIFGGLTKIRFYSAVLDELHEDLVGAATDVVTAVDILRSPDSERLPFDQELVLDNVTFRYPGGERDVLRGVQVRIPKYSTIGLVGSTGAGKTTLVDLLLGLIEPQGGEIRVDSTPLKGTLHRRWRQNIGYVPQDIFLCDDTIARNIAFGLPDEMLDHEAVRRAARIANLHDFIVSLPRAYETVVGERGVRLSGGQRQRIGIARAVYGDPGLLVLDEATSALDGATEDGVMEAMLELSGQKTIVLIAHRLTTVRSCDRIYLLQDGQVADSGTYDELMERSAAFRAMAKAWESRPVGV